MTHTPNGFTQPSNEQPRASIQPTQPQYRCHMILYLNDNAKNIFFILIFFVLACFFFYIEIKTKNKKHDSSILSHICWDGFFVVVCLQRPNVSFIGIFFVVFFGFKIRMNGIILFCFWGKCNEWAQVFCFFLIDLKRNFPEILVNKELCLDFFYFGE